MIAALKVAGTYYAIFCAKTAEIVTNQDEIEVTNINSGANREYIPGMSDHTLSCSGITTLDNSGGQISLNYLNQQAQRRAIQELRVSMTDDDAGTLQISFNGFLTSATLSKQTGAYSQSSVTFRITGPLTYSETITPPTPGDCEVLERLELVLAEGDTSVQDAALVDVVVLMVAREGMSLTPVTGTPGNRNYRHDPDTGEVFLDVSNPGVPGGEAIDILYKIEP